MYPYTRATIRIKNLALRAIIGFNGWEREKPQELLINCALDFDAHAAIQSDAPEDTLDYKAVKQAIIELVENSHFNLLEALCGALVQRIMSFPQVLAVTVEIDKPHALRFCDSVSVTLSAERPR
jgi:D-erythro-7,8-dihydroneopterin triphosphate epimerase